MNSVNKHIEKLKRQLHGVAKKEEKADATKFENGVATLLKTNGLFQMQKMQTTPLQPNEMFSNGAELRTHRRKMV